MSISSLLLGIWLILVGSNWLGWLSVDTKILGLLAFITGIVLIIENVNPSLLRRR